MQDNYQAQVDKPLVAAIDAGGTTFKCALIHEGEGIIAGTRVPTTTPNETLAACLQFFNNQAAKGHHPTAMGIASFGPIDVDTASPNYGMILNTPKRGWASVNLKTYFESSLGIPVNINTDVNGALLAEMAWGAAQGVSSAAYVTIGTGIGAGFFANGGLIGKPTHPEFGHIHLKRHPEDSNFAGVCSFHRDCLEGLASATSVTERFGSPAELPADHIAWDIEAYYLAQACSVISLTIRSERIILGGGIMLAPHLIGKVRAAYLKLMCDYLLQTKSDIENLIVTPGRGDDAGLYGGARLAHSYCA